MTVLLNTAQDSTSSFRMLLWSIMETVPDNVQGYAVVTVEKRTQMSVLEEENCQILYHPCGRHATDVRFQQSITQNDSHYNVKYWYSKKNTKCTF